MPITGEKNCRAEQGGLSQNQAIVVSARKTNSGNTVGVINSRAGLILRLRTSKASRTCSLRSARSRGTFVSTAMSGLRGGRVAINDLQPTRHQLLPLRVGQSAHAGAVLFHELHAGCLLLCLWRDGLFCSHGTNLAWGYRCVNARVSLLLAKHSLRTALQPAHRAPMGHRASWHSAE